jgi:type 1 glutamine amidotransferase
MKSWLQIPMLVVGFLLVGFAASAADSLPRVLVYTKNGVGFVHDNRQAASDALVKLGKEHQFAVDVTEDPAMFTTGKLSRYKVIVFNNTNNEIFDNEDQKNAFQAFVRNGGGFVGLHSATGSMRKWPWFWDLIGGSFARHPKMQPFTVIVKDPADSSTKHLPATFEWTDEFYFMKEVPKGVHVLLAGDLTRLQDPAKEKSAGGQKEWYPLAWKHEFEGGRSWYTALGHKIEHYSDPKLTQHILGGIRWAMGQPVP